MKSKEKTTKYKNIKNILKKIIKKATIILSIIVMNTFTFIGTSGAVNVKKIEIKKEGECGELITYRGKIIKTDYIYHEKNGKKYPAYCLEKAEYGISANLTETVISEGNIHDIKLWKYIINGYPYKTYQALGCKNKEEAYGYLEKAITYVNPARESVEFQQSLWSAKGDFLMEEGKENDAINAYKMAIELNHVESCWKVCEFYRKKNLIKGKGKQGLLFE